MYYASQRHPPRYRRFVGGTRRLTARKNGTDVKPTPADDVPAQGPASLDLDSFLFAGIYDEPNGMTLSVISALARLNVDPWREAARLAELPRSIAAATLAGMIDRLFPGSAPRPDVARIAARLVRLLPDGPPPTSARPARILLDVPWFNVTPSRVGVIVVVIAVAAYLW
jgi:hypothetical protein